jgi:hypothetical protein
MASRQALLRECVLTTAPLSIIRTAGFRHDQCLEAFGSTDCPRIQNEQFGTACLLVCMSDPHAGARTKDMLNLHPLGDRYAICKSPQGILAIHCHSGECPAVLRMQGTSHVVTRA